MNKTYALFNENKVLIQTKDDLMGDGFPDPWIELPAQLKDIQKGVALASDGTFKISPGYDYKFNVNTDEWEIDIEMKKLGLLALAKTLMNVNLSSNIDYAGYKFNADPQSQDNVFSWQIQANLGNLPSNFQWRDADNSYHNADVSFINGLALSITNRKTELYKIFWGHKDRINAISIAEEANSYDVKDGWPVDTFGIHNPLINSI